MKHTSYTSYTTTPVPCRPTVAPKCMRVVAAISVTITVTEVCGTSALLNTKLTPAAANKITGCPASCWAKIASLSLQRQHDSQGYSTAGYSLHVK